MAVRTSGGRIPTPFSSRGPWVCICHGCGARPPSHQSWEIYLEASEKATPYQLYETRIKPSINDMDKVQPKRKRPQFLAATAEWAVGSRTAAWEGLWRKIMTEVLADDNDGDETPIGGRTQDDHLLEV